MINGRAADTSGNVEKVSARKEKRGATLGARLERDGGEKERERERGGVWRNLVGRSLRGVRRPCRYFFETARSLTGLSGGDVALCRSP